jgi:hypothetical protein
MKKVSKMYKGFKVINLITKNEESFIYTYGNDSVYAENLAIKELMEETGLSRSNFAVSGLIKR